MDVTCFVMVIQRTVTLLEYHCSNNDLNDLPLKGAILEEVSLFFLN
ncbi:hypothetical protein AB1L12_16640 [Peribacillus frigoritolerans]